MMLILLLKLFCLKKIKLNTRRQNINCMPGTHSLLFNPHNTLNNEWPHLTGHEADSQGKTNLFKDTREQAGGRRPRLEGSNALPVTPAEIQGVLQAGAQPNFSNHFPHF